MSLRPSMRITANLLYPRAGRLLPSRTPALAFARSYSDEAEAEPAPAPASAPPLLQKIQADLKAAMRAKDAARLSVLRGVLSATQNASKARKPIKTDAAVVTLLRKQKQGCADARAEFATAGRDDLVAKEDAQIAVLDEYVSGSGVEVVSADYIQRAVRDAIAALEGEKPKMSHIMKTLSAPGGALEGTSFHRSELVRIIKAEAKLVSKSQSEES
ncbi:Yqey-like protein-domain-containing protein [Xylaria sp. FL1777]|nr:Yqey-like protein-domain-containing protein [Xylaria sp. FL1777]